MGGKRRIKRQHLYVCLAGVIAAGLSGCVHYGWIKPGEHLQPVQALVQKRDFDAAVEECQRNLSRTDRHADDALFDLGLLYSHYANPKKDYQKSLGYFTRLIKEHPRSRLVEESKTWVNLLETLELTKRVDIELEEKRGY